MYNRGDFSAFAAFADVEWRITDRFSLIGGARYTRDEKTFSWLNGPRVAPELDQALAELDALGVLALAGVSPADFGFDVVFDLVHSVIRRQLLRRNRVYYLLAVERIQTNS